MNGEIYKNSKKKLAADDFIKTSWIESYTLHTNGWHERNKERKK